MSETEAKPTFKPKPGAKRVTVDISVPAHRYVELYSGAARDVIAISREGLRVRFPGKLLHRFLTHDGVYGTFIIDFDSNNKFLAINKIV